MRSRWPKRGVLDGQKLKELKGPPGHKNMAFDLLTTVAMFRETWSVLGTPIAYPSFEQTPPYTTSDFNFCGERCALAHR